MNTSSQPSADAFITHLIATLPDLDARITDVRHDDTHLHIVRGEDVSVVEIAPFASAYLRRPDALDAVVQTLLRVSQGERSVPDPGYQAIAPLVVPQLKPIILLNDLLERGADPIVYRIFLADLIITYAILDRGRLSYITELQLDHWEVSEYTLHSQAIANLQARSQHLNYHVAGSDDETIIIFNHDDGLDAARLLLPGLLEEVTRTLPGNAVIGIPNRDFMVILSDSDPDRVSAVALQIAQDMRQHAHGVSERLFTLMDGEIREYDGY